MCLHASDDVHHKYHHHHHHHDSQIDDHIRHFLTLQSDNRIASHRILISQTGRQRTAYANKLTADCSECSPLTLGADEDTRPGSGMLSKDKDDVNSNVFTIPVVSQRRYFFLPRIPHDSFVVSRSCVTAANVAAFSSTTWKLTVIRNAIEVYDESNVIIILNQKVRKSRDGSLSIETFYYPYQTNCSK